MADELDRFLASSLSPVHREPDRRFVAAVQARILLEERLARQRRALLANLAKQLIALFALAAGAWIITHAAPIADWSGDAPAIALAILLGAFALFLFLIARPQTEPALPSRL